MPREVYILDSSFLIWLRQELPDSLSDTLDKLSELVGAQVVVFPRQVREELDRQDDHLSGWAKRCWRNVRRYDVDVPIATEVIPTVEDVIDSTKTRECADPWIIALAVEYQRKEPDKVPTVVANDYQDKNSKRSLRWGCEQYDVRFIRPAEFLLVLDEVVRDVRGGQLFPE